MLDPKVWIVIPAYNEEKNIQRVINELQEVTSSFVVVNDGSADNTAAILQQANISTVNHLVNRGMGAALQTGNDYALQQGAEIIVHFDADGQMLVNDIARIIEPIINKQTEIVLGSRFLDHKSKVPWTKKYFIHFPARIFNWLFTGLKLSDAHCGFRALSREAAAKININQDGMAHATEILEQIRQHNLSYQEMPVEIIYHEYGQNFFSGIKIVIDLLLAKIIRK